MYIYNERLIQEFHMILTVAATSMYLILKSVGLAVPVRKVPPSLKAVVVVVFIQ